MTFESLPQDLQEWVNSSTAAGHTADQIIMTLKGAGHSSSTINTIQDYAQKQTTNHQPTLQPQPQTTTQQAANIQKTSDRDVEIQMVLNNPKVVIFADLLSHDECKRLINLSKSRLTPSTVIDPETGECDQSSYRTSSGASFKRGENKLIKTIENRISQLLDCPLSHGEPIQVLNYGVGAQYKPHFDYFDPKDFGSHKFLQMGGQRYATLIMYLNDVEAGGATSFPKVGLDIMPRKGSALFFAYSNESGFLDDMTLHVGNPVEAGEKWIATKWLRFNDYTGPMA